MYSDNRSPVIRSAFSARRIVSVKAGGNVDSRRPFDAEPALDICVY